MPRFRLLLALCGLALSACAPVLQAVGLRHNVTVLNTGCRLPATVFIDGQNVGQIPGGGVQTFQVSRGSHTFNVDNDGFYGPQTLNVTSDRTWRGGSCL